MKKTLLIVMVVLMMLASVIPQRGISARAAQNAGGLSPDIFNMPEFALSDSECPLENNPSVVQFQENGRVVRIVTASASNQLNLTARVLIKITDDGKTWRDNFVYPQQVYPFISSVREVKIVSRGDSIYLAVAGGGRNGYTFFLYRSDDRGETFSFIRIEQRTGISGIDAIVDRHGMVHIMYGNARALWYLRSEDGETFKTSADVASMAFKETPPFFHTPILLEIGDSIYVFWQSIMRFPKCSEGDFGLQDMYVARSDDGLQSFSMVEKIVEGYQSSFCAGVKRSSVYTSLTATVDKNDNMIRLVYSALVPGGNRESDIYEVHARLDQDKAWSSPTRINTDTMLNGMDQLFPAIAINQGKVIVTFLNEQVAGIFSFNLAIKDGDAWKEYKVSNETIQLSSSNYCGQDYVFGEYFSFTDIADGFFAVWPYFGRGGGLKGKFFKF